MPKTKTTPDPEPDFDFTDVEIDQFDLGGDGSDITITLSAADARILLRVTWDYSVGNAWLSTLRAETAAERLSAVMALHAALDREGVM